MLSSEVWRHPDPKLGFMLRAIAAEKIARRRELHH
jgi:hypothetical protein